MVRLNLLLLYSTGNVVTRAHFNRARWFWRVRSVGIVVCSAVLLSCASLPCTSNAQGSGQSDDQERVAVDRYLQVLLRRPRPGVALDRVYGYHVQNDSLDELQQQLSDATASDFSNRQMAWGLVQLQRGQSAEAATILADVESKLTDDAACSFYLGRAYLAVGQTELAAAAMERAIDRGPSRAEALPMFTELGRIYSRVGEHEKSLAVWTRLEALFPGDTRVGGQIARTLAEEGNHEQAMIRYEQLSKTAKKDEEKVGFEVQAAEMRRQLGKAEEATSQLEKILARLRPGSWLYTDVRNRIEDGFLKSGDYDSLADYYQNQLKDRPNDLTLQTRLSRIMITAGRLVEAQTLLQSAISKAPDDTETRLTLIDVLIDQNHIASASTQFEELVKRDPNNPDHLIRWGQTLLDDATKPLQQRHSEATAIWNRLAQQRSDDPVTLSQIADRMRGIGGSNDAIKLYRKSIELDPNSPQYREYLGEYLYALDRQDEAITVWKSIASEDRRGRESLVRLAEIYGTFKRPALALGAWKDASEFDLTFAQELRYAAKLTEAKQYTDALQRLDRAEQIAETPDEREQLLKDRIVVYQTSGTLGEQIANVSKQPESIESLRKLALMYGAFGDLVSAERSIRKAVVDDPENTQVLLVAADIAERQNRIGAAADLFGKLASVDSRFRTNYLQRVASLQIRLGQNDKAMRTCAAIIDANPASPESYQFYARTAFGVNRDEEAIAALRRAMTVAPRDNSSRRMLASHFADRYRTDEAIELYWQAFQYEPKTDDQITVIRALAPLYDRKADLETLLGRIEEINRKAGSVRTTKLMVAAAHEAVQDFGAARDAIEQLLAVQPRDVTLLETMVQLSDAADESELAADYQRKINELADTPENRFKLLQFQLEAGSIDVAQVLSQRLAFPTDPSRLSSMVRLAIRRGDLKTAREICREVLRNDDSLWDIKLTLAQLLMIDRGGEDGATNRKQAIQLAQQVRAARVEMDAAPPTQRKRTTTRATGVTPGGLPAGYQSNPIYWSQASSQLARTLRVGRYASQNYSSSNVMSTLDPSSFGHARVIAASLILVNAAIDQTGEEASEAIQAKLAQEFALPDLDAVTDPILLWERFSLINFAAVMTNTPANGAVAQNASAAAKAKADATRKQQMEIMWRLAEIDPKYGVALPVSIVSQRMISNAIPSSSKPDMTPLSLHELKRLAVINNRIQVSGFPPSLSMGLPTGAAEMMMQATLGFELRLAGLESLAAELAPNDPGHNAKYHEIAGAIQFHLQLHDSDKAGQLVNHLLPAARRSTPSPSVQAANPTLQIMMNASEAATEFNKRYQAVMVDAAIARWAKQTLNTTNRSTPLGDGYVSCYSQHGGNLRSVRVRGPLSTRLLDSTLAQQVLAFANSGDDSATSQSFVQSAAKIELSPELIEHLETPLPDASPDEAKTRSVVAAYAHWWADRPEQCYKNLVQLCELFPADVDLQIERARLASELKQPKVALEALDSFSPLDSRMLIRKEMAAMNLAAQIGDTARAKVAAERLFGMRLDVPMQLALADQLKRLGLDDQAAAMLQRTRSSRVRDESTELKIANAFLNAGDKEAAGEVAYSLLRRLSSGRSRSNSSSRNSSYQRQAVSILTSAGRFQPLIERAKRRAQSAPKSFRAKQELADLYTAAGKTDEADQVWQSLSDDAPASPQQLIARANALVKAKKNREAIDLYLDAFEKDPSRFSNDFYSLYNAARSAGQETTDLVFTRLTSFPIDQIPSYRLRELVRLGSSKDLSDAKRKFIGHVLKSPSSTSQIYSMVSSISIEQRATIPEYREAIINALCSDDAFVFTSSLWSVQSRSSGGRALGPLPDILSLLRTDADAEKTFRAAAANAIDDESKRATAKFLLALLQSNQRDQLGSSLTTMAQCIDRDLVDPKQTARVSSGLLWQAGQILETNDKVPVEFLIKLYQDAKSTDATTSNSPEYTLNCKLVDTYLKAKRFDDARSLLLELYNGNDYSSQNQYNPGYGDYQKLQAYQWIAEKLVTCQAPVDALIVYQSGLADPAGFDRAKQWGGSRDLKEAYEAGADAAAEKITPKIATQHLIRLVESWEDNPESDSVELMESSAENTATSEFPSIIAFSLGKAVTEEESREKVIEFASRVEKLADTQSKSWRLAALNLLTAFHLGAEGTDDLARQLFERLPRDLKVVTPENEAYANSKNRDLFDLYPVAQVASRSTNNSHQEIGRRIVNYLSSVAESLNDSSFALALAEISGEGADSIKRILDVIESQSISDGALSESAATLCMQVAKDAAKAGQVDTATRALRLALQNGPPLRQFSSGGDAFAIASPANRSPARTSNPSKTMGQLATTLIEVTNELSAQTGVNLSFTKTTPIANGTGQPDSAAMSQITDAYLAILAPPSRDGSVYSYAKPIATSSYDRIASDESIVVVSASTALAKAAAWCDRSNQVYEMLLKRFESAGNPPELAIAMVQVATAQGEFNRINESLAHFSQSIDSRLPARKELVSVPGPVTSITSQMASESQKKSEVVNLVLNAIWPIIDSKCLTNTAKADASLVPEIADNVAALLNRTDALINSDSYTANRHREIRRRLSEHHISLAKSSGNTEIVDAYIQSELNGLQSRTYPSGVDLKQYQRRALESLTTKLIDDGLTERMDQVFRQAITTRTAAERNYTNRFEPHVCLAISQLTNSKQFELLQRMTFGRTGNETMAYFEGLVSYEVPPPLVSRQHPMLEAVIDLPTSTKEYPITNSLLMLIDAAIMTGNGQSLQQTLKAQTESPGDQADIALALLEMALAKKPDGNASSTLSPIRPTLTAVADRLVKNLPKKNDDTIPFPSLEAHLIVRAYESGVPVSILEPMIRKLKVYAIRGERNLLVSAVARSTAKMGIGRAANGTSESPFRHFHVIPISARYRGDNELLRPLYSVNGQGWISGTSGYEQSHLMFKYPLTGSFTFSAKIQDGGWGEADLSYGGVIFQANGWQQTAQLLGMGNRGSVDFKVPSIQQNKLNEESVSVTPDSVQALCNGQSYVSDLPTTSYPFVSVYHRKDRTSQFRDVRFAGNPEIPDEVNLIHPTMRGWGVLTRGNNVSKMLLPIGPKQNRDGILKFRENMEKDLAKGPLVGRWSVVDGELHYKGHPSTSRTRDPKAQIQYVRPLQDGESIDIEFYWKADEVEFAPSIGRLVLKLSPEGAKPDWIVANGDLASVGYIPAESIDPPLDQIAADNVPIEDSWNKLRMKRTGHTVAMLLNDKPLITIPVKGHERPGVNRYEKRDLRIRSMRLTGDWPDEFPSELLVTE